VLHGRVREALSLQLKDLESETPDQTPEVMSP
jgi:hypothetical protein